MKLVRSIVRGFGTVKYQVGAPVAPPCANESTEKATRNVSARKNKLPLTRICLACNGFVEDSITMTPCFCGMQFCLLGYLDHFQLPSALFCSCLAGRHAGPQRSRQHALSIGRMLFCISTFVKAKKSGGPGFLTGASNLPREEGMAQRLE